MWAPQTRVLWMGRPDLQCMWDNRLPPLNPQPTRRVVAEPARLDAPQAPQPMPQAPTFEAS